MSEESKVKGKEKQSREKGGLFKGIKSEFKKVIWPDKDAVIKKTSAVILVTIVLGVIIAVLDSGVVKLVDMIFTLG